MRKYTPRHFMQGLLIFGLLWPLLSFPQVTPSVSASSPAQTEATAPEPTATGPNVLTRSYTNTRLSANNQETSLNVSNVVSSTFGKLYTRQVNGQVYAQPLFVGNLNMVGLGTHNVVFVATEHNSVYAFDADDPNASTPLWQANLTGGSGQGIPAPIPNNDFGNRYGPYHDIRPEVGITSTPVIDAVNNKIYVVNFVKEGSVYHHYLYALDIRTGLTVGQPKQIAATTPGTGINTGGSPSGNLNNSNNTVVFDSKQELQRPGLLLVNGVVYMAFAGYADTNAYHGWIMAYDATTLNQVAAFCITPNGGSTAWPPGQADTDGNGGEGGIWMSGQGIAADDQGYVYVVTGNGTFSANISNTTTATYGADYGNSLLKIHLNTGANPSLQVVDWFTPYNWKSLNGQDADLGVGGVILPPITSTNAAGHQVAINGSKTGEIYLTDRTNFGHITSSTITNDNIIQSFQATFSSSSKHIHGSPVFYNAPTTGSAPIKGPAIYLWGENDYLRSYTYNQATGKFNTTVASVGTVQVPAGMPGGIVSVSSNNGQPGTGVVWAIHPYCGDANTTTRPGVLRAYDATDLSKELWNSEQIPLTSNTNACSSSSNPPYSSRDRLGYFPKFNEPMVTAGKVFAESFYDTGYATVNTDPYNGNKLVVYGLLNAITTPLSTTTSLINGPSPSNYGQAVVLTATITANNGIVPSGVVSFTESSTVLGTASLDFAGMAVFTTTSLVTGTHFIKANYGGAASSFAASSRYVPSASALIAQKVGPNCIDNFASVTSNTDDGLGTTCNTLSFALSQSANLTVPTTINLNVGSITINAPLPTATNGNGQPITIAASCNAGTPGTSLIAGTGAGGVGLTLDSNIRLKGVKMGGFGTYAVRMQGSNNALTCSWLGTIDGQNPASGSGGGLDLIGDNNTLGQAGQSQSGNLIAGNSGIGLQVESGSKQNQAYFTWLGLNAAGNGSLANGGGSLRLVAGGQLLTGPGNRVQG